MMTELCDLPAYQLADMIRQRQVSAQAATESVLARIKAVDGISGSLDFTEMSEDEKKKVHAFITVTAERALERAAEIDRQFEAGEDPGPLAGVPFSVKDLFCVNGVRTTAGSKILSNFHSPYTATPVKRMEEAGAIMVGKVNLDEFAYGSSSESSAFQPSPRNPWDTSKVPGGSSGGSAVAVAAGEGHLSIGTDTAGSIRQPAAFCGVVGMKPTYGRVSRYGMISFGSSLDCPGPLGRNIRDTALMLKIIAGADPRDATSANVPVPDYPALLNRDLRGMRIGLSPDYFQITFPDPKTGEIQAASIDPDIEAAVMRTADLFAKLGAEIVENVPMPHNRFGIPAYFVVSRVEAASNLHRFDGVKFGYRTKDPVSNLQEMYYKTRAQGFGLQPKLRVLMGMYVSSAQYEAQYYNRALRVRSLIRSDFEKAFDPEGDYRLQLLLTPTTPSGAFPIGDVYGDSVLMQYADQLTVAANHAGVPGISFPGGLDSKGMPIGIQLLGPDFSEATLLQVGKAFEDATAEESWRMVKPHILQNA